MTPKYRYADTLFYRISTRNTPEVVMMKRPAKLADVASRAGVSLPTASQVMNGTGRVAKATRARVLSAARELDYRPNALARSVASGHSRTIGILAENAAGAFCMPVLIGINRALSGHDLASVLYDAAQDQELRRNHVRHMIDRQVDGVVVIGEGSDIDITELEEHFAGPVVHAFGPPLPPPNVTSITANESLGGYLAAQRFLEMGRHHIAHVTASSELISVQARLSGLQQGLSEGGGTLELVLHGEFSREWGMDAARKILADHPQIDAIFAGNDAIAIGLAAELEAAGRHVPEAVAIIGFDNTAGYSFDIRPYLESVDPQLAEVGRVAADFLVARLSDPNAPEPAAISPTLVPGASTRGESDSNRRRLVEELLDSHVAPPVLGVSTDDAKQ